MPQVRRSQRLSLVLDLLSREEETERAAFGEIQASIQIAENKLEELINFQQQYQAELKKSAGIDSSVRHLQNYHIFISRLGAAIEQQHQQLMLLRQRVDVQRKKWQLAYQKKSNMGDLITRCRNDEQVFEDKKFQREMDDAICRQARKAGLH